jgi:hypothetical protein
MQAEIISLRVSREELAAVLNLLDIPSLPGMGENFLEGLNANERGLVLAAGRHALRARGWMEEQLDDDGTLRLVVDPTLLALVGECSRAAVVTVVNRYGPTPPPITWYIHQAPHLHVIHRIVASGVHELVGTVNRDALQQMVLAIFPITQGNGATPDADHHHSFHLAQITLDEAIAAVREGETARVEAALHSAGLDAPTTDAFASALRGVVANSMMARLNLAAAAAGDGAATQSFSLLETADAVWMLRSAEGNVADLLQIERVTPPTFAVWVAQLLA